MFGNNILGKLSLDMIPLDEPIVVATFMGVAVIGLAVVFAVLYFRLLGPLWNNWIVTVDHKKIGIMYIVAALVMFVRGLADAFLMRTHLVFEGSGHGFLPPHHYDQIFTAHGTIMIFFMAMPFMTGLINIILPLQLGARDMAFPFLNALSFWLFVAGAILVNLSLFIGSFATTGWVAYVPVADAFYSPGVGVDYYLWAINISGVGSLLSGVNFIVTILKCRAPGMKIMKMPIFSWSVLATSILIVATFPVLTVDITLLTLDRYLGTHFFTQTLGGSPMMYVNLIWIWGHPEVYVLVLPAFGIYSEIVATFCRKRLFGYSAMIYSMVVIVILSLLVWLHHFFTMGSGANVNTFFGLATMAIAIPTGVKIFNWLFTMRKGKIDFQSPMYWVVGFIITFSLGGMTGVLMSIPAADFQIHGTLFLVAHFHNTIIGGVVFGYLAALVFWWPRVFGFKLNETLGKLCFFLWFFGFYLAFMPVYVLGLMGVARRVSQYDNSQWQFFLTIAAVGTLVIGAALVVQVLQILVSIIKRKEYAVKGDAWDHGRTLEWSIKGKVPFYNFAVIPKIKDVNDPYWEAKEHDKVEDSMYEGKLERIHMPRNSMLPFIIGMLSTLLGFTLVFHIFWLALISFIAIIVCFLIRSFDFNQDYYVEIDEIERIEKENNKLEKSLKGDA